MGDRGQIWPDLAKFGPIWPRLLGRAAEEPRHTSLHPNLCIEYVAYNTVNPPSQARGREEIILYDTTPGKEPAAGDRSANGTN